MIFFARFATSVSTEPQSSSGTDFASSSCHFSLTLTFHPAEFLLALAMG
jgi:hypothetical protein